MGAFPTRRRATSPSGFVPSAGVTYSAATRGRKLMNRCRSAFPVVFAVLAACWSAPSSAAEMAVSQYGRVTATLPWAVAMEKGFFAAEGVKVDKIISGEGGGTTLRNMLASDLPYGEVA